MKLLIKCHKCTENAEVKLEQKETHYQIEFNYSANVELADQYDFGEINDVSKIEAIFNNFQSNTVIQTNPREFLYYLGFMLDLNDGLGVSKNDNMTYFDFRIAIKNAKKGKELINTAIDFLQKLKAQDQTITLTAQAPETKAQDQTITLTAQTPETKAQDLPITSEINSDTYLKNTFISIYAIIIFTALTGATLSNHFFINNNFNLALQISTTTLLAIAFISTGISLYKNPIFNTNNVTPVKSIIYQSFLASLGCGQELSRQNQHSHLEAKEVKM